MGQYACCIWDYCWVAPVCNGNAVVLAGVVIGIVDAYGCLIELPKIDRLVCENVQLMAPGLREKSDDTAKKSRGSFAT